MIQSAQSQNTNPLVSVVIPVFNGADFIAQTIDSVLAVDYAHIEVIVVDDGSTDKTLEILLTYQDKIQVFEKSNGGPASARNLGVRSARGEFVAFLDGDDLWEKNKLRLQMPLFENPDVGLVYSRVQRIDANNKELPEANKRSKLSGSVFLELFQKNCIPTSTVVVRKKAIIEAGYFDEDRTLISVEDYDLWLRVAADNKIDVVDQPLVRYRHHQQGISKNHARSYMAELKVLQNNLQRFQKRFPDILKNKPQRLAQLFFELATEYFSENRTTEAIKYYRLSLHYQFFQPNIWLRMAFAVLGPKWIEYFRTLKNSE